MKIKKKRKQIQSCKYSFLNSCIRANYQLQILDIGDNFQIKVSTNGLDDTVDYSKPQPTIPIKSRIEPQCQAILKQIQQHPRLQLFFQSLTHYHDILYASGEEISKTSTHNSLVISSLCIHLLNHVMKVQYSLSSIINRVQILRQLILRVSKRKNES